MRGGQVQARTRRRRSGQALVEAALTLPLTLFLILGSIQIFLMQQARIMAEYAAMRAVRAGSVNFGDCRSMTHAAVAAVLPTFSRTDSPEELGRAFRRHADNNYAGISTAGGVALDGPIVWIFREEPTTFPPGDEFDTFGVPVAEQRLEVRLVFWYPLRIPFADWVLTRMFLAHYGLQSYLNSNPLNEAQDADWPGGFATTDLSRFAHGTVAGEFAARAAQRQYVYPIQATYSMRMMTPAKPEFFTTQDCLPGTSP